VRIFLSKKYTTNIQKGTRDIQDGVWCKCSCISWFFSCFLSSSELIFGLIGFIFVVDHSKNTFGFFVCAQNNLFSHFFGINPAIAAILGLIGQYLLPIISKIFLCLLEHLNIMLPLNLAQNYL
jgi:hypothetical protein